MPTGAHTLKFTLVPNPNVSNKISIRTALTHWIASTKTYTQPRRCLSSLCGDSTKDTCRAQKIIKSSCKSTAGTPIAVQTKVERPVDLYLLAVTAQAQLPVRAALMESVPVRSHSTTRLVAVTSPQSIKPNGWRKSNATILLHHAHIYTKEDTSGADMSAATLSIKHKLHHHRTLGTTRPKSPKRAPITRIDLSEYDLI